MAPILPGITDQPRKLREVVAAAIDAGATHVSPILLHLRPGVREEFMPWLEGAYPELAPRYRELYARSYAPPSSHRELGRRVSSIVRALGGLRPAARPEPTELLRGGTSDRAGDAPDARPTQLTLV